MPAISPVLDLGIQTLGEAIQLTPASPALAIITSSRNIMQMINEDRGNSVDEQQLALKVLDIAIAYSDHVKKLDENERKDTEIGLISNNLHSYLESISQALVKKPKAGFLARLLSKSSTRQRIKRWEADLEHLSSILDTQIQLRNIKRSRAMSSDSEKGVTQGIISMEERIQKANQEALDLIKSQVLKEV